jgi:hypothetical protein
MTNKEKSNTPTQESPGRKRRSGSDKRKRPGSISIRVSADERIALEAAADRERLSLGGYIRTRVLSLPSTRARHRPSVDLVALAKVQHELNKIGGNIYQLLRHVNFGRLVESDEIRAAFAGYREAIGAIMAAIRRSHGPLEPEPVDDEKAA